MNTANPAPLTEQQRASARYPVSTQSDLWVVSEFVRLAELARLEELAETKGKKQ